MIYCRNITYKSVGEQQCNYERTSNNLSDGDKVFARVDVKNGNEVLIRYQYDNHLGSACLELDHRADVISYEEYHPFGTTSYRAGRSETEVSLKRYKYCGKERDEETGLYYYGARYYAAWICRWISTEPLKEIYNNLSPYSYAMNNPITYSDKDGNIIVDKDGNPVYTVSTSIKMDPTTRDGITSHYETRIYYTNEGDEILTFAVTKQTNEKGEDVSSIPDSDCYFCHSYAYITSTDNLFTPDNSEHKVILGGAESVSNKDYNNVFNILNDEYTKLGIGINELDEIIELAKIEKIVGLWVDNVELWQNGEGKAEHSAIVSPNAYKNNAEQYLLFLSKNGFDQFLSFPYGGYQMEQMNVYGEFEGFYQHNGNVAIDINTEFGYTKQSTEEIRNLINNK